VTISQRASQESTFDEIDTQISHLNDQAARLAENYAQTGSLKDLNEAIRIIEQVIDMVGEYITPLVLSNLGANARQAIRADRFDRRPQPCRRPC
jgi:hypothetical protein